MQVGYSEKVTFSRDQNEMSSGAMRISLGRVFQTEETARAKALSH